MFTPSQPVRVLAIPGSLRHGSYNRSLLTYAQERAPEGMQIDIFDLHDLPMFNTELEGDNLPSAVAEFRAALFNADAYIFASPEYNWSISGVLKNALDWASRSGPEGVAPINAKPALLVGAGGRFGTMRAQMHLREILQHNDLHVLNQSLMVPNAWQAFDENNQIVDAALAERYVRLLDTFAEWIARVRPIAQPA